MAGYTVYLYLMLQAANTSTLDKSRMYLMAFHCFSEFVAVCVCEKQRGGPVNSGQSKVMRQKADGNQQSRQAGQKRR